MISLTFACGRKTASLALEPGTAYSIGREIIGPLLEGKGVGIGQISLCHFRIFLVGDQVALEDGASYELPSTNGTWVNGQKVNRVVLHPRDQIGFWENGPTVIVSGIPENFRRC